MLLHCILLLCVTITSSLHCLIAPSVPCCLINFAFFHTEAMFSPSLSFITLCRIAFFLTLLFRIASRLNSSDITFCQNLFVECTFFGIGAVGNLSLLPFLVLFTTCPAVINVHANVMRSVKTVYDILSSLRHTVLAEILTRLSSPVLGAIHLLYKSDTHFSAAEGGIGGRSVYTFCPS